MKKIYFLLFAILLKFSVQSQTVATNVNGSYSANVVVGQSNYHVSEAIYTETEIGASNFTSAGTAINKIGYNVFQLGSPTTITNFKIRMKNVPLATTTFNTGNYNTNGYTLVFNGTVDFSTLNWNEFLLTTPFVRTPGTNLQVMVERGDGVLNTGYLVSTTNGNQTSTTLTTSRRANTTAAIGATTSLTASAFRPAIELIHVQPNDASISDLVTPPVSCYSSNQNIGIVVSNSGLNNIAAGAVSVVLKISGANTYLSSPLTNAGVINPGSTETITFNGIDLSNPGINYDTAFLTFAGDGDHSNDSGYFTTNTSEVLSSFPISENVESTPLPVFWAAEAVVGSSSYWGIKSGPYKNTTTATDSLNPRAPGTNAYLFDSYNAPLGSQGRLYSKCIQFPNSSAPKVSFYMSHDSAYAADLDSMYVSVSTDKGLTWTRLAGYQRADAAATRYYWKKDSIDLTAYSGQLVQIGFEGVGAFGNAILLDDINVEAPIICHATHNITVDSACDSYTWTTSGLTYTTSGAYVYTYLNDSSCPSADTLYLTIHHPTHQTSSYESCVDYVWNGITCNATGDYTYDYINAGGCPSTDTLHFTLRTTPYTSEYDTHGCDSLVLPWGETVYTDGPYQHTYNTLNGCDSIVTANVTIHASTSSSFSSVGCDSLLLPWGQVARSTGTYVHVYQTIHSCDSTVTANITINPSASHTYDASECVSYALPWGGFATTSGSYSHTYTGSAANGCDSVVTVHVTINKNSSSLSVTGCDTVHLPWTSVNASGTYSHVYTNSLGCDSTVTATVTVNKSTHNILDTSVVGGLFWHGTLYSVSGSQTYNYINSNGCPSTDILNLTILIPADVFIYPNPNNGIFTVSYTDKLNGVSSPCLLTVYDEKGARVFTKTFPPSLGGTSAMMTVDMSKFPSGVYHVEVSDAGNVRLQTGKFVIYK